MHPIPTPSPIPSALLLISPLTEASLSLKTLSGGVVASVTPLPVGDANTPGSVGSVATVVEELLAVVVVDVVTVVSLELETVV